MAAVANVAVKLDAAGVVQQLNAIRQSSIGAAKGFEQLSDRARAVKSIVEAQQGGFAKASTIQGVFSAKVRNTEQAIRSQINALRQVQSQVKLGGALYQKAQTQIDAYNKVLRDAKGKTDGIGVSTKKAGLGLEALGLKFALVTAAIKLFTDSLNVAFARGAAEQRLRNITSSTEEYELALALAARTADKFGMSQTETTKALGDVYGRLKGVGFGLKETAEIYEGFNFIAKQSGLTAEDAAGTFFQLSQALGKGKLNGDEFVTVAERMPQLLDAIANATGKSRGELQAMAQEGQITSEVLYKALAGSANAAGDLNGKLNEQQKAFNSLRQVGDQLLNTLGKVFAPVVVKGAEMLAAAGQMLSEWWGYIGGVVFPQVVNALQPLTTALQKAFVDVDFEVFRVFIQNILIKGFEIAVNHIRLFSSVVGFVVTKIKELSNNPVFKFMAEQVGRLANHLGLTNDKVGQFAQKQKEVQGETLKTLGSYSSMPQKIEDSKEAAKRLKTAQKEFTEAIKESGQAIDTTRRMSETVLDQQLSVRSAYLKAEMQINDVLLSQAQRQLDGAKTQEQRTTAAKAIYDLTVKQARLEYQATTAQIAAEVRKLEIARLAAEQKVKEVQIVVQLAAAQGALNTEHLKALNTAKEALKIAEIQQGTATLVANEQQRAAKAILEGKINAAGSAYQTNLMAKNTQGAATAATGFANEMERAAAAAARAHRGAGVVRTLEDMQANIRTLGRSSVSSATYTAEEAKRLGIGKYARKFAKGGMVTGPTLGMIGEGGESEFIIPQSKAAGFAVNYLSGKRGASAIPGFADGGYVASSANVNIQTGPVTQMNGTNYVTTQDMGRAVQAGVQQTLDMIRRNNYVRTQLGLA